MVIDSIGKPFIVLSGNEVSSYEHTIEKALAAKNRSIDSSIFIAHQYKDWFDTNDDSSIVIVDSKVMIKDSFSECLAFASRYDGDENSIFVQVT